MCFGINPSISSNCTAFRDHFTHNGLNPFCHSTKVRLIYILIGQNNGRQVCQKCECAKMSVRKWKWREAKSLQHKCTNCFVSLFGFHCVCCCCYCCCCCGNGKKDVPLPSRIISYFRLPTTRSFPLMSYQPFKVRFVHFLFECVFWSWLWCDNQRILFVSVMREFICEFQCNMYS